MSEASETILCPICRYEQFSWELLKLLNNDELPTTRLICKRCGHVEFFSQEGFGGILIDGPGNARWLNGPAT